MESMNEEQLSIRMALLLRQMLTLHGSRSDEWKGTAEWCAAAARTEEEVAATLRAFVRRKYSRRPLYV